MSNDAFGATIVGIGAVFALTMLVRGFVTWGDLDDLVRAGWTALAVVIVLAVLWLLAHLNSRRVLQGAMTAHVDTHGATGPASYLQRLIGRHEIGHVVGAEVTGMGVAEVRIADGRGYVRAKRFTTVDDAITFLAAGHLAVHTKRGADGDLAGIRNLAAELPRDERGKRLHAAIDRARVETARQQARIKRDGHRLADTGRW